MIPAAFITAWRQMHPWPSDAQVEQDLIICKALVEIFSVNLLYDELAFRGGTAIHKLYIKRPVRYSEDIDLVRTSPGPSGEIIDALRGALNPWLGTPKRERAENSIKLIYRVESEIEPVQKIRLKVEINTREHDSFLGYVDHRFSVDSPWFQGQANLKTFSCEELFATKLRALYQRKKGRDLLDLMLGLTELGLKADIVVEVFQHYIQQQGLAISKHDFLANLEEKVKDRRFTSDTNPILASGVKWDIREAKRLVEEQIIPLLPA